VLFFITVMAGLAVRMAPLGLPAVVGEVRRIDDVGGDDLLDRLDCAVAVASAGLWGWSRGRLLRGLSFSSCITRRGWTHSGWTLPGMILLGTRSSPCGTLCVLGCDRRCGVAGWEDSAVGG